MDEYKDLEQEGILRVPIDATKGAEENRKMREHHNANHALWYLTMIVHAITHEKPYQNTKQKTERVLAHLSHLREFINDPTLQHKKMIESLFDFLLSEHPASHSQWTHFVYMHWNLIQNFADHYGHKKKCFPDSEYHKISDIVHHVQYFRKWWWDLKWEALYRKVRFAWARRQVKKASLGESRETQKA